jgi:hypothetical protein
MNKLTKDRLPGWPTVIQVFVCLLLMGAFLRPTSSYAIFADQTQIQIPNGGFLVTGVSPAHASLTSTVSADVIISLNDTVNLSTVNTQTFTIRGEQSGIYSGNYSLTPLTFDSNSPYRLGEEIVVTVSDGVKAQSGTALTPYTWSFRPKVNYGTAEFIDSSQSLGAVDGDALELGDLNGDGHLDAIVLNDDAPDKVYLNDGIGNFAPTLQNLGSGSSNEVALGDVDSDGDLDAFIVNMSGISNVLWLNDGQASFTNSLQALGTETGYGVDFGDIDGDGDLDALVCNNAPSVQHWDNNGSAVYSLVDTLATANCRGIEIGDFNNDGWLDVYLAVSQAGNQVWLNDGAGNLVNTGQSLGTGQSLAVALGDFNNDGALDAYVTNGGLGAPAPDKLWLNNGSGSFSDSGQNLGNNVSRRAAAGDFNADSFLDVFIPLEEEGNLVWINDGTGVFTSTGQILGTSDSRAVAVGDLNGDGSLDAYVVNNNEQADRIWLNEPGSRIFAPIIRHQFPFCFSGPVEEEPNDSANEANGPLCDFGTFTGLPKDVDDYFFFETFAIGTIELNLTDHPLEEESGAQLILYFETTANPVAAAQSSPYTIDYQGATGLYFVQVFTDQNKCTGAKCNSEYSLTIDFLP